MVSTWTTSNRRSTKYSACPAASKRFMTAPERRLNQTQKYLLAGTSRQMPPEPHSACRRRETGPTGQPGSMPGACPRHRRPQAPPARVRVPGMRDRIRPHERTALRPVLPLLLHRRPTKKRPGRHLLKPHQPIALQSTAPEAPAHRFSPPLLSRSRPNPPLLDRSRPSPPLLSRSRPSRSRIVPGSSPRRPAVMPSTPEPPPQLPPPGRLRPMTGAAPNHPVILTIPALRSPHSRMSPRGALGPAATSSCWMRQRGQKRTSPNRSERAP